MPAIRANYEKSDKEKVACELPEYQCLLECDSERGDDDDENDEPMNILQPPTNGFKLVPFVLACIAGVWITLTFWLIVYPTPNQYARSLCSELLYDSSASPALKEEIIQKLGKQLQQFNELTALYGKYFNASAKDVSDAMQNPFMWYIFFSIIVDGDINEIDMSSDSWDKFVNTGLSYRMRYHFQQVTSKGINCGKVKQVYNSINTPKKSIAGQLSTNCTESDTSTMSEPTEVPVGESSKPTNFTTERLDANKILILYDNVTEGDQFEEISKQHYVTLTIQSSLDHLESFVASVGEWDGPISLAVFLNGQAEFDLLTTYLNQLSTCYPRIYEKTRISVASPLKNPVPKKYKVRRERGISCEFNPLHTLLKINSTNSKSWIKVNWYPQNTMRNLAKYNALTTYHLTLDVDIRPSAKMSSALNKFFQQNPSYKNALVVPTYEVSKKTKFPSNKAELVSLRRKGLAQPFHKDVFLLNQNATNFAKWEKLHDTFNDVNVVHEVSKFHLYYEPFFIEHSSSPIYNESFVGYGFTRSSHAYEMYLKNGNFQVLSPIFTAQLGLQKVKQWSAERQRQNEFNRRLFEQLVQYLNDQPHSDQVVELSINGK